MSYFSLGKRGPFLTVERLANGAAPGPLNSLDSKENSFTYPFQSERAWALPDG